MSGSSHMSFQYDKATFCILHKAIEYHFSFFLLETPSTCTLMKILELERVKELLNMAFQVKLSHLEQLEK